MLDKGGGNPFPALFLSSMRLPLASVGQTGAASCAATSQDLTAIGSSHALAEPVDLGAMTLLRLIGTNHSDTPPVSISSGMQASANHNSRIAPAAVVSQMRDPYIHDYAKVIIAEKNCPCQPKISMERLEKSRFFSQSPRCCGKICLENTVLGKIFFWNNTDFVLKAFPLRSQTKSPLSTSKYIIHLPLWKKSDTIYYLRVPLFTDSRIPSYPDTFPGTVTPSRCIDRNEREGVSP